MGQNEGDFGIRLNIRGEDDFSTPLSIPPGIQTDGYENAAGYSDTFANEPYTEQSGENDTDEYGYGDYGENYRNYIDHPRDFTARNTFFLIGGLLLFGLAVFFIVSIAASIHANDILAESINTIDFSMVQVEGPKNERVSLEEVFAQPPSIDEPDTAFVDELSDRIKYLEGHVKVDEDSDADYVIYTDAASHFLIADQLEKYFGTLYCDAWGLEVDLAYTNSQQALDEPNSACVLTPDIKGLPGIGEPGGGASVIVDNNTQEFSALQYAQPGDKLYITTVYGEFIYEVSATMLGMIYDGQTIILENNQNLMDYCTSGAYNGIAMYTAYPFDNSEPDSNYCFVVLARLVDGTSMTL